ncbi:MAG: PQQ-binding-like beta-propeller repeat protein [Lentisphaerae bacterium]|nr:PQQ-binding-like beta-propeller repeat protein [Lentisphaerota bacterium]MBT4821763.1 PQQ-binding-like beta-propeller repeat protein [Lentisphaerota bacterium]
MLTTSRLTALLASMLASMLFPVLVAPAADWPTYRGDAARSGGTTEELAFPLGSLWHYASSQPPRPAWPDPRKEMHRLDFDFAPQPVMAAGLVFFGSSADDTVRAIEARTGRLRWRFTAAGPIRFSPFFYRGNLHVVSDDGWAYCLDAESGRVMWKHHGAPNDGMLLGNGRMISRWPLRSGPVVMDGIVYVSAGMWPSQGVYLYALDAETGERKWTNNSSGTMFIDQPHGTASAFTGVSPQGYMLGSPEALLVPTGRSVPAAFDLQTGRLKYYYPSGNKYNGGTWACIVGDTYFNATHNRKGANRPRAHATEGQPARNDGMGSWRVDLGTFRGLVGKKHRVAAVGNRLYATGDGLIDAYTFSSTPAARKPLWQAKVSRTYALAATANAVLLGGQGTLTALNAVDGSQLWAAELPGQVRGIAVSDGRLVVSTTTGTVHCFGAGGAGELVVRDPAASGGATAGHRELAGSLLEQSGATAGHALVLGQVDARLAEALAGASELQVVSALNDQEAVNGERTRLLGGRLYGSRVTVHHVADLGRLPFASYFASLIIVGGDAASKLSGAELYRLLRPHGGAMVFTDIDRVDVDRLIEDARVVDSEIVRVGRSRRIIRGSLPGSGQWTHHKADAGNTGIGSDTLPRLPLEPLWFGGPGPDRMPDRHSGVTSPVSVNGRVFVTGLNVVIAFDAYTGRELWECPLEDAARMGAKSLGGNLVADNDSLYVVAWDECVRIDQVTGKILRRFRLPGLPDGPKRKTKTGPHGWPIKPEPHWGYLNVVGNLLLGSVTERSRANWSPKQKTTPIFALNKDDGTPVWTYAPGFRVNSLAIAQGDERLFLISGAVASAGKPARRGEKPPTIRKQTLKAIDTNTGTELWSTAFEVKPSKSTLHYAKGVVVAGADAAFDAATGKKLWQSPHALKVTPIIHGNWIISQPFAYDLRTGELRRSTDPVTGVSHPWTFPRSYGCGTIAGCESMLLFRSATAGFFDFIEEGTTNFGAVRPNCSSSMIAAGGLVIMPEASSGCTCSYNFQTSLALAPARNAADVWYSFKGWRTPDPLAHIRLNLGAPGDRRDTKGDAWLGFPRPVMYRVCPVPATVAAAEDAWSYTAAHASRVTDKERPWVYTSGVSGQTRLMVDYVYGRELVAAPVKAAPTIDGKLDDVCWKEAGPAVFTNFGHLAEPKTTLLVCRDDENIYLAYRRDAIMRDGKPLPFVAAKRDDDENIERDDAVEIALGDATGTNKGFLLFGISASGTASEGQGRLTDKVRNFEWDCSWQRAVHKEAAYWSAELAIPLAALEQGGLDPKTLGLNACSYVASTSPRRKLYLLAEYRMVMTRTSVFMPLVDHAKPLVTRSATVRLHFVAPERTELGEGKVNISIQGTTVLQNFCIPHSANTGPVPVIKTFPGIPIAESLFVEMTPVPDRETRRHRRGPLLCGVEALLEGE